MTWLLRPALSLAIVAAAGAQGDSLHGTWEMNTSKSSAPNVPKAETMIVDVSSGMERGSYDITAVDGTKRKVEYEAKIVDEAQWTRQRDGGSVMIVKLDESTSLRISKRPNGRPSMALRAVAKDGRTFTWTTIEADGKIGGTYLFEKQ
jgi:hypothetical protein